MKFCFCLNVAVSIDAAHVRLKTARVLIFQDILDSGEMHVMQFVLNVSGSLRREHD